MGQDGAYLAARRGKRLMPAGRPLRFLLYVAGAWTAMRIVTLWPGELPAIAAATLESRAVAAPASDIVHVLRTPATTDMRHPAMGTIGTRWLQALARPPVAPGVPLPATEDLKGGAVPPAGPRSRPQPPPLAAGVPRARPLPRASRWSGSAWLVARHGSGAGTGFTGPQLGGSQAGLRIAYALGARLAIAARVASPLGSGQRDAAIGLEWRPTRLPIRLVAEQRFALGPGRAGPAIGMIGGFGPAPIAHGLRAEGYGQAGYIARNGGGEGFADGAVRVSHPLGTLAHVRFDLGASAWGAAQKGASRLDIGPSLGAIARIGEQHVRFSLEWRQRVAGNATPASGPALSAGMDF
jgi:hypothetical protein